MKRKLCLLALSVALGVGVLLGGSACSALSGPSYPDKDVTFIVNYAAGSTSDRLVRALSSATSPHLGKQITVKNVAGAQGLLGSAEIARAKPDGYTIGQAQQSTLTIQVFMEESAPVKLEDFEIINLFATNPVIMAVKGDSAYKTLDDIIADAKKKPNGLSYGYSGIGTSGALAMEDFKKKLGVNLKLVPFNSAGEGVTAALGGQVDFALGHPPDVLKAIQEGRLRAILAFGEYPLMDKMIPGVKSFKQLGYDYSSAGLTAVGAPKGLPKDVKAKLQDAFKKGTQEKSFQDFMDKSMTMATYQAGDDVMAQWLKDRDFYKKSIQALGLYKSKTQ